MNGETPHVASVDAEKSEAIVSTATEAQLRQLGELLEQFRPYLQAIAAGELPGGLRGKIGISDLVQETILRGYESFGEFRGGTREELAGWLRSILINQLANTIRMFAADKRAISREEPANSFTIRSSDVTPSREALNREQTDQIEHALAQLPDDQREVVLLRHRDGLSFKEIANRLHKSEDAARKQWSRAIQVLQDLLPQDDES